MKDPIKTCNLNALLRLEVKQLNTRHFQNKSHSTSAQGYWFFKKNCFLKVGKSRAQSSVYSNVFSRNFIHQPKMLAISQSICHFYRKMFFFKFETFLFRNISCNTKQGYFWTKTLVKFKTNTWIQSSSLLLSSLFLFTSLFFRGVTSTPTNIISKLFILYV